MPLRPTTPWAALAATAVAFLVTGAPAAAQVPGDATFGGGAAAPPGKTLGRPGDREIGLRTSIDAASVRVRAVSVLRCRGRLTEVSGGGTAPVGADGAFSAVLRVRRAGAVHRIELAGRIAGTRADGTMTATVVRGERRRCALTGPWTAIVPPEFPSEGNDTSPTWAGVVRQPGVREPLGVMLRTGASDNERTRVLLGMQIRCRRRAPFFITHYARPVLDPIGEFEVVDRFTVRTRRTVERVRTEVTAFAVSVGFTGTARSTSVVRSRRTGRVVDRCDTGPIRWSAAP